MALPNPAQPRVCVETSVVSYLASRPSRDFFVLANQQLTQRWWEEERAGYRLFASMAVVREASRGDVAAAARRMDALGEIPLLAQTEVVLLLAKDLQLALEIPPRAAGDAEHLAYAVAYEMDYLLSWNCTHLANAHTTRMLEQYALRHGIWLPTLCTPASLIEPEPPETNNAE